LTPGQFASKAKAAGYSWACLELDDYDNSERWGPFLHACHAEGLKAGPWFTEAGNITQTPGDADFAIAELEGPGDYDGLINAINTNALPACPKAVCTNFNHPIHPSNDPTEMAAARAAATPLIAANLVCLTESYLNENVNASPDNMNRSALSLGWATSQPVFGRYSVGGNPPPSYAQWAGWSGRSDYLAEYLAL